MLCTPHPLTDAILFAPRRTPCSAARTDSDHVYAGRNVDVRTLQRTIRAGSPVRTLVCEVRGCPACGRFLRSTTDLAGFVSCYAEHDGVAIGCYGGPEERHEVDLEPRCGRAVAFLPVAEDLDAKAYAGLVAGGVL